MRRMISSKRLISIIKPRQFRSLLHTNSELLINFQQLLSEAKTDRDKPSTALKLAFSGLANYIESYQPSTETPVTQSAVGIYYNNIISYCEYLLFVSSPLDHTQIQLCLDALNKLVEFSSRTDELIIKQELLNLEWCYWVRNGDVDRYGIDSLDIVDAIVQGKQLDNKLKHRNGNILDTFLT